jgi:NADPH-dependent 7-cyano-7-deazaguanine reductase QueF
VTYLMRFKSKYNFSNQCYNDIMKLIIDLIPVKHNISKDLYQFKKIVSGLAMN